MGYVFKVRIVNESNSNSVDKLFFVIGLFLKETDVDDMIAKTISMFNRNIVLKCQKDEISKAFKSFLPNCLGGRPD